MLLTDKNYETFNSLKICRFSTDRDETFRTYW